MSGKKGFCKFVLVRALIVFKDNFFSTLSSSAFLNVKNVQKEPFNKSAKINVFSFVTIQLIIVGGKVKAFFTPQPFFTQH